MTSPTVLFLGGTGIISSACTTRALAQGFEVFVLNRGTSTTRPLPEGVQSLVGDLSDSARVLVALDIVPLPSPPRSP